MPFDAITHGESGNSVRTKLNLVPAAVAGKADTGHTHDAATTGADGFMSAADKQKLNGVATGATANVGTVTSVAVSGSGGISVTGSPVTTSGTVALNIADGALTIAKTSGLQVALDDKLSASDATDLTVKAAPVLADRVVLTDSAAGFVPKEATLTSLQAALGVNDKAPIDSPTFTGTVSGITATMVGLGNVTNTADADKPISTATQAALDAKAALTPAINAQTGTTYTLALADAGRIVTADNAGAVTVTIPANATAAFPVGTIINVIALGAGAVTLTGATGVTVNGTSAGSVGIAAQYQGVSLAKLATDTWVASGALT